MKTGSERCFNDATISRDYGMTWEALPDLPYNEDWHGELIFVTDSLLLFQGDAQRGKMYFLDLESKTWSEGPKWKYQRRENFIGVVTQKSGEIEIVNVGGVPEGAEKPADTTSEGCCTFTKTVEIYNLANNTVRDGQYLHHLLSSISAKKVVA